MKKYIITILSLLLLPLAAYANSVIKAGKFTKIDLTDVNVLSNASLKAWWTFDGKSIVNGTVTDSSGNGNTGNPVAIATSTFYVAGKIGQGVAFNGTSQYINLSPNVANFNYSAPASVNFWIKGVKDVAESPFSFSLGSASTDWSAIFMGSGSTGACTNPVIVFKQNSVASGSNVVCYTNATRTVMYDGKWHMVSFSADGSTYKIYLDGVSEPVTAGFGSNNGFYGGVATPDSAFIGAFKFNGAIGNFEVNPLDDMRLYNHVLSQAEVTQLYNMGSGIIKPTL